MAKYYAYINKGIRGPLLPKELSKINGFDHNTLVCEEENFGKWVDVSTLDDFSFLFDPDFYDVSAETRKENDVIEDAEQISQSESEDANAYKAVLERAISVNGELEKQVKDQEEQLKVAESKLNEVVMQLAEKEKLLDDLSLKNEESVVRLRVQEDKIAQALKNLEEKERQITEQNILISESVRKLEDMKAVREQDRSDFSEILRKKDLSIKELESKLAKAPKPEDPSWERLYKAAKQRADDIAADFAKRLQSKDAQIKFLNDTMEKNEVATKLLSDKRDKEVRIAKERIQFSLDQKEAELSTLKTDLQIKDQEISALTSRALKAEEERKRLQAMLDEKEKQAQDLALNLAEKESAAKKVEEIQEAIKRANEMLEVKEREISLLKASQITANSQLTAAKQSADDVMSLKHHIEEADKQLLKLKEENAAKESELILLREKNHSEDPEVSHLKNEIIQKETELSNIRADLSEATRRIQEVTTNEEINARKRDEFYEMVNKKISLLSDYIREIEGKLSF